MHGLFGKFFVFMIALGILGQIAVTVDANITTIVEVIVMGMVIGWYAKSQGRHFFRWFLAGCCSFVVSLVILRCMDSDGGAPADGNAPANGNRMNMSDIKDL